jgi:uncharacterized protein YjbJ (UPF0337 family)
LQIIYQIWTRFLLWSGEQTYYFLNRTLEIQFQGTTVNKDQVKGSIKKAAGKVEEEAGKLVSSAHLQFKGSMLESKGVVQKNLGDAKQSLKHTQRDEEAARTLPQVEDK